ncbi:hypothetical protein D3C86_1550760 [compost metagenome]
MVNFKVETEGQVALVTLKDESGQFIETGSTGKIDGKRDFVVGYDGQAYLDNISDTHRLRIMQPTKGECEAQITVPSAGETRATLETLCRSIQ